MKKRIFVFLLSCVLLCIALIVPAAADDLGYNYIYDEAGILSEEELATLDSWASNISSQFDCGVYVCVVNSYSEYTTGTMADFAEKAFNDLNYGIGENRDCVAICLSIKERDYYMLVRGGFALYAFSDYYQEQLENGFIDNLRENDWYGAFSDFISYSASILDDARANQAADGIDTANIQAYPSTRTETEDVKTSSGSRLLVVILLPCIISLIVCKGFVSEMQTARLKTSAGNYVSSGGLNLKIVQDQFLHRTQTRIRIKDDSSKKGGGSGGGGFVLNMGSRGSTSVNSRGFSGRGGKF